VWYIYASIRITGKQRHQSWKVGGHNPPQILGRGIAGGREILLYLVCTGNMFESGDFSGEIK